MKFDFFFQTSWPFLKLGDFNISRPRGASVLASFPTFPMELAQQKLVYTSLAACPMEICYEFYFFRNFVHFKASGLVIFFSLALTSEKHLYQIQKALRAEKKLAPQCCRPPKCVYHQKCAPSCHSTPSVVGLQSVYIIKSAPPPATQPPSLDQS